MQIEHKLPLKKFKRLFVLFCFDLRCERSELCEQVCAVVAVDLDRKGLAQVKAENAEDGLCIDDILAALEQDLEIAFLRDGNEILDALCLFE